LPDQELVILALEDLSEQKMQQQPRQKNARLQAAAVGYATNPPLVVPESAPVAHSGRRVNAMVHRAWDLHKRILVVDDETAVCELMTVAFARVGCDVIAAEYAEEAIAAAKSEMFPVMFIDLNLPGMNGIDLFKAIKALHPSSEAYLITGYASESDLQKCRSAGFRDCLMKPISFPVMFQAAQAAFKPRDDVS
jgi:CheY-like chemotaxis protein